MDISTNIVANYETGSLSTVDLKLKRNYYHRRRKKKKKIRQFVLSQVCLQENMLCSLALTVCVVRKTRDEFSLHPRWEVREGGNCVS